MNQDEQQRLITAEREIAELDEQLSMVKAQLRLGTTMQGKDLTPSNVTDLVKLQFRIVQARAMLRGAWPTGIEGGYSE